MIGGQGSGTRGACFNVDEASECLLDIQVPNSEGQINVVCAHMALREA